MNLSRGGLSSSSAAGVSSLWVCCGSCFSLLWLWLWSFVELSFLGFQQADFVFFKSRRDFVLDIVRLCFAKADFVICALQKRESNLEFAEFAKVLLQKRFWLMEVQRAFRFQQL